MEMPDRKNILFKTIVSFFVITAILLLIGHLSLEFFSQIKFWNVQILPLVSVSLFSSCLLYFYYLRAGLNKGYINHLENLQEQINELMRCNGNQDEIINELMDENTRLNNEIQIQIANSNESNRLKSMFLQNLSHEICTPLNAIMGFAQLIPGKLNDKEKLDRYSTIIYKRGEDLHCLLNELLEASRLETGTIPLQISDVNISDFLLEIMQHAKQFQIELNKTDIEVRLISDCPDCDIIQTDRGKLMQILTKLIHNAIKFTNEGLVEVGCYSMENRLIVFYVSDTGIGISEDLLDFIFKKFTQVDHELTRKSSGFGLGLAIVKGLVELLGGYIMVTSIPAKGTIFTLTIPNKKSEENDCN